MDGCWKVAEQYVLQEKNLSDDWLVELKCANNVILHYVVYNGAIKFISASDDEEFQATNVATKQQLSAYALEQVHVKNQSWY